MEKNKLYELIDTLDFCKYEHMDLTKSDYTMILDRYRESLNRLDLSDYIGCIVEDAYKLGFTRALGLGVAVGASGKPE